MLLYMVHIHMIPYSLLDDKAPRSTLGSALARSEPVVWHIIENS